MRPLIADRDRRQPCDLLARGCRAFGVAVLLALAPPGLGAEPDTTAIGVAVFGSYLNPGAAEREAVAIGERLGVTI